MTDAKIRITGEADVTRMRAMTDELRKLTDGVRNFNRESKTSGGGAPAGGDWGAWQAYHKANPIPWAPVSGMADEEARDRRTERDEERRVAREERQRSSKESRVGAKAMAGARAGYGYGMAGLGLLGLGGGVGGVMSWLFQSGEEHLQQSTAIKVLEQRFGSLATAGDRVKSSFWGAGHSLGFVNSQMAGLMEALGAQTNTVSKEDWQQFGGFAKHTGMDPGAAMGLLGHLERLTPGGVTVVELAGLKQQANKQGMGRGRLPEFLQNFMTLAQEQFQDTGKFDFSPAMNVSAMPSSMFSGEAGRGEMGLSFVQNMNQAMTGSDAAKTFLLRSMGYGREGGPDYMSAKERLEAGIHGEAGAQNLLAMSEGMRGWGKDRIAQSMEKLNPNMKMWQIRGFVETISDDKKYAEFKRALSGDRTFSDYEEYVGTLSEDQRKAFEEEGYFGLGKKALSEGESMAVTKEAQKAEQGDTMADVLRSLNRTLENLRDWMQSATGQTLAKSVEKMTDAIEGWSEKFEKYAKGGEIKDALKYYLEPDEKPPLKPGERGYERQQAERERYGL
ncbi:MAG: hypothetical protein WC911_01970 [Thermoleophilia bacterium]